MCTITRQLCLIHPSSTIYSSLAPAQPQTSSPLHSAHLTWKSSQISCTGVLRTRLQRLFSLEKVGRHSKKCHTNALSEADQRNGFNERASSFTTIIPLDNNAAIYLFGVQHCERQPHIAEHILRIKPSAVVVETAITTRHGLNTGNVIRTNDQVEVQSLQTDFYARMFFQLGSQLQNEQEPWFSSIWKSLACQFGGEQLAYIAAFATKADLIFGDRPKEATFQRLYAMPSLLELDAAFSHQSALNYQEQLTGSPAVTDWSAAPGKAQDIVEQIMMRERDYILAQSLRDAALTAGSGNTVVGVIGEAHLAGVQYLLQHGEWLTREELQDLSSAPTAERCVDGASIGVRLALLEAAVRLRCRPEVCAALRAALPPVPPDQLQQYEQTTELYGTCRMLLAGLDKVQLTEVASGWRCNFYDVLEPVRAVRPVNGGHGYDEDLIMELRLLNFEVNSYDP